MTDETRVAACVCGEINTRHCPVHGQGQRDLAATPQWDACDKCSVGVMDDDNPHVRGECNCLCHAPVAAPVLGPIVHGISGWWWSCSCGSLGGGWPNRDLALDEAEAHAAKHEEALDAAS